MSTTAVTRDIYPVMEQTGNYSIQTEGGRLIFRTKDFIAEKSSVLHSGVYSRESSSILFASGVCGAVYFLLAPHVSAAVLYTVLIIALVTSFVLSRAYLFRDRYLEAVFDKDNGKAYILVSGAVTKKREEIALDDIVSIETGSRRFEPENKDGADFVQKISVQHGSAVPGLGEPEEFVTLSLKLRDGSERTIYAGKLNGEPELPVAEIRRFLPK